MRVRPWRCLVLWPCVLRSVLAVDRVVAVRHGEHLEDLLHDTRLNRPAALVVLYDSRVGFSCAAASGGVRREVVHWGRNVFPSRAHLFVGTWDQAELDAVWWNWRVAGGKYDLFRRFNATRCPFFVLLPPVSSVEPTDDALRPKGTPPPRTWGGLEGEAKSWREWIRATLTVNVTLRNTLSIPVLVRASSSMYDHDGRGQYGQSLTLAPGGVGTLATPLGAGLQALDAESPDGEAVWRSVVLGDYDEQVRQLDIVAGALHKYVAQVKALQERANLLNRRDQDTSFRHVAIIRQPPVMPVHSPKGEPISSYKLADIPKDLEKRILSFYHKHQPATVEPYPDGSTGINAHEVATGMVSYDRDRSESMRLVSEAIQPLVEEWAQMPLKFTSLYGVREYYRGAELRKHVDRVSTHVYSVIIHVARENLTAEWPLEVYDFNGEVKTIDMGPGQILFYQSAKLVHGRPVPLRGDLYANLFCHFQPATGWEFKMEAGDQLHRNGAPFVDYLTDSGVSKPRPYITSREEL